MPPSRGPARDNAGGGARGVRGAALPAVLSALAGEYGFSTVTGVADVGGSSNLNLAVRLPAQRRVLARLYRRHVTSGRLAALQLARHVAYSAGCPVPLVVRTVHGAGWVDVEGRLLEVEEYVAHDAVMDTEPRLISALPWLGRLHEAVAELQVGPEGDDPRFANHIRAEETSARTRVGAARIRSWGPTARESRLADQAEELAEAVEHLRRDGPSPAQTVHGDFWDQNVLMRAGRVVAVTDWDFMGRRPRIDDLALTLYFAGGAAVGEDTRAGIERVRRLVDAYDGGLRSRLSADERADLPVALARQPLWGIGGWVAVLDDEAAARRHAAGVAQDVAAALAVCSGLDRWREGLGVSGRA